MGVAIFALGAGPARGVQYTPVARVATPDGYSVTAVQQAQPERKACEEANRRFTDTLKSNCAACRVQSSQCKVSLIGEERAAAMGRPVKAYSVTAPGIRLIITGPAKLAKAACEQIAVDTVQRGAKQAACVSPGIKP